MMNVEEFLALKSRVEEAQQEADKATGALEETMRRLKSSFGYTTLVEAKKGLAKLERVLAAKEKEYRKQEQAFEEQWNEMLGE